MTAEDPDLIRRFVDERSQEAFADLVRRHADLVYSAALRQVGGDAHLARDVTQSVFLALARKAPGLGDRPSLTGWLYTAARNCAIRAVRDHQRWRRREQEANAMREPDALDYDRQWARLEPMLDEAMHELSEPDREAVLLRFFENRPFAEIGSRCGLAENAARMRVERALDKLRSILARRGVTSTVAALGTVLGAHTVSAAPAGLAGAVAGSVASQAPGAPWLLTLVGTTKIQLVVLGVTAAFNLGVIRLAWAAPTLPPRPAVEQVSAPFPLAGSQPPFVPPPTPLAGDFNDPAFLARKLWTEGYSETVIRTAVYDASRRKLEPEAIAIRRAFGINPGEVERWKFLAPMPAEAKQQLADLDRRSESEANDILRRVLPRDGTGPMRIEK